MKAIGKNWVMISLFRFCSGLLTFWYCLDLFAATFPSPPTNYGRTSLWEARHGSNVLYLAGSIHVLRPTKDYPVPALFEWALTNATKLVTEANPSEFETEDYAKYVEAKSRFPSNDSLGNHISNTTKTMLVNYCISNVWLFPIIQKYKPWQVSLWMESNELMNNDFDFAYGLENHLVELAKKQSKPIEGLESGNYLIDVYNSLPEAIYIKNIEDILLKPNLIITNVINMINAWKTGDTEYFYFNNEECRSAFAIDVEQTVDQRNRLWLPKIENYLQHSSATMVVVGSAHLPGPDGLINLLRLKGYDVEQLPRSPIHIPKFGKIEVSSRELTFETSVEFGRSYQIQDIGNLSNTQVWTVTTNFFATNSTVVLALPKDTNPSRIFRLITPPQ